MNYLPLIFLPFIFWLGFWAGQKRCRKETKATWKRRMIYQPFGEVVHDKAALVEIREGRTKAAVEFMECSMDYAVSLLWHTLREAEATMRDPILKLLRDVKSYRQHWPRQVDLEALAPVEISKAEVQKVADEVTGILAGIPPSGYESPAS